MWSTTQAITLSSPREAQDRQNGSICSW
jgi:hypothetical protein